MSETDRHGYAVSAGKDGDPAVTAASAVQTGGSVDVEAAIIHLNTAIRHASAALEALTGPAKP